jgi:antitoxin (DNA-binding transcriptional repressor) of toxin-antitoxin stability system
MLSPLTISRARRDEVFAQVNEVLEQIRQGASFTITQAQEALAKLEQVQAHPRLPETEREKIQQLGPRLAEGLQKAQEYDQKASAWLQRLEKSGFDDLLRICDDLGDLPGLSLVLASHPPLKELRARWEEKIQTELTAFCDRYARLDNLADYKAHEDRLKRARKALEQFPLYVQQIDGAFRKLSQTREELEKREGEKTIVAEINSMASSAALKDLYKYRDRLQALTDLSPVTARLRDEKLNQISTRIQQYEQIAAELLAAVGQAIQLSDVSQQKSLLLRNIGQLEGTQFYQPLLDLQKRIEYLEAFFERLRDTGSLPQRTPNELDAIESQLDTIEAEMSSWLGQAQKGVLEKKRTEIRYLRHQKAQEARDWLDNLERRYERGDLGSLLHEIETLQPPFLQSDDRVRLEQFKQLLQQRMNNDTVLQIESLFRKITDVDTRRRCLERLQELVDAQ